MRLKEQIVKQNNRKDKNLKKLYNEISTEQTHIVDLETLNANQREELTSQAELNATLAEQIDELNDNIKNLKSELKIQCGDFLFNCRELKKVLKKIYRLDNEIISLFSLQTEYMAILDVLQYEKERILLQLQTMESRLRLERERQDELHEKLRRQNTKYNRLECKYSI